MRARRRRRRDSCARSGRRRVAWRRQQPSQVLVDRVGVLVPEKASAADVGALDVDAAERLGLCDADRRREQQAIDDRERGEVRAEADGQRGAGQQEEGGHPAHGAQRLPQVEPQGRPDAGARLSAASRPSTGAGRAAPAVRPEAEHVRPVAPGRVDPAALRRAFMEEVLEILLDFVAPRAARTQQAARQQSAGRGAAGSS